ncbi:hypothetical protein CVT24_007153 [Panaeolus cyanescens]|uniref:Nodulin-like domain-containing protein n=1 Tax=Panaeolus cyanescens TaxID=181874 RepID=A0A409YPH9_9AGAR|nr:hypothetical protein CVT24_007153 [Panaeolus cyanescens]
MAISVLRFVGISPLRALVRIHAGLAGSITLIHPTTFTWRICAKCVRPFGPFSRLFSCLNLHKVSINVEKHDKTAAAGQCATNHHTNLVSARSLGFRDELSYSPQLGARLGISHTQLNIVGFAGNMGVYASGPIWGRIIDTRGPRIALACGFVFLLGGYYGIRSMYDGGLPDDALHISTLGFCWLVFFSFLTGSGGNGGLTSSVNSTAKTFPDHARASTTGLVISGFGLSAFFFSSIAHIFFAGNISAFLLVLALGTSFPMIMGFFLVRPIPLPEQEGYDIVEDEELDEETLVEDHRSSSHTHLLDHDFIQTRHPHYVHHAETDESRDGEAPPHIQHEQVELTERPGHNSSTRHRSLSRGAAIVHDTLPNVYGRKLWRSSDFWLLFSILSMLSGTGLMYINNVGSMSQALYAFNNPDYDEVTAAGWQATQVSAISLMNFLGRIFIGLVSDYCKNKFDMPRSYSLVIVSVLLFISQLAAATIDHIAHLWIASSLLGLAYGSVFSLFPTVCLEWFGMPHFSENWGYLSMSPMVAGNLFSVVFGRNLDAHDSTKVTQPSGNVMAAPQCTVGLNCYVDSIYLTLAATFLSILLSVWAGYRDKRKIENSRQRRRELSWDEA